jgi:hypothetical protein
MRWVARVREKARKGQNSQSRTLCNSPAPSARGGQDSSIVWPHSCPKSCGFTNRSNLEYKCIVINSLQKEMRSQIPCRGNRRALFK